MGCAVPPMARPIPIPTSSDHRRVSARRRCPGTSSARCAIRIFCASSSGSTISSGILTPVFEHPQPFWFFGPILLLAILPWILFSVIAIADAVRSVKNGAYRVSP